MTSLPWLTAPIAHAGDWIEGAVILAPITIVFLWLGIARLRDHRRARREGAQPAAERAPAGSGASDSTSGP